MSACVEVPMARIREVSAHFDNLVDLIPAKFYLDAEEVINLRHMKKSERASTKMAFKQQHKLAKQAKLDPDAEMSTTAIQKSREEQQQAASTSGREVPALHANPLGNASKEELQARLQERIQAMRDKRKADERVQTANKAKQWKQQQHQRSRQKPAKRPREPEPAEAERASQQTPNKPADKAAASGRAGKHQDEVMFSKLHVQEGQPAHKKVRKQSKQQLLRQAEEKAGEAQDKGMGVPQWDKFMRLAQGDKVLDNPALLRKALKKEGKAKSKKATAWQMRNKATAEKQQARQQKRQTNLQKRVDSKKATKIAKREKKLMRPGFEGRATSLPRMSS